METTVEGAEQTRLERTKTAKAVEQKQLSYRGKSGRNNMHGMGSQGSRDSGNQSVSNKNKIENAIVVN